VDPAQNKIETIVISRVEIIRSKASIPIVERKRVKAMLKTNHLCIFKCKTLLKSHPKIPNKKLIRKHG